MNLHALIEQGEHSQQDFKFRIDSPGKIAKTLAAFANTDGGRLLVGVKDNGRVAGIRSEEERYVLDAAAKLFTKPRIHLELEEVIDQGKTVLIAHVPKAEIRPVKARESRTDWWAYIRIADQNIKANGIIFRIWKGKVPARPSGTFAWDEAHRHLFDRFKEEYTLSASSVARLMRMEYPDAQNLLAKLYRWDIVSMWYKDGRFVYTLHDMPLPETEFLPIRI